MLTPHQVDQDEPLLRIPVTSLKHNFVDKTIAHQILDVPALEDISSTRLALILVLSNEWAAHEVSHKEVERRKTICCEKIAKHKSLNYLSPPTCPTYTVLA